MSYFSMSKTVLGSLFKKRATLNYPKEPKRNDPLVRGHIENDIAACIFCGLCDRKCPTNAIKVVRDDKTWAIKPFYCIQCGECTSVCPTKCLHMKSELTAAGTDPAYAVTMQGAKEDKAGA